jgi:hypothetical protein
MWSFLHLGYGREPQKIRNILDQKRFPTKSEIDISNQQEITNCGQKSAYIAKSDEIELEMIFLSKNYFDRTFTMGKDMISQEIEGWRFSAVRKTKIPNYYRWLIDSGVYNLLQIEKLARKVKLRKATKQIQREQRPDGVSSMEGGLVTLFILCGVVILLALIFVGLECRHIILGILMNCYFNLCSTIKMCRRNLLKCKCFKKIRVVIVQCKK